MARPKGSGKFGPVRSLRLPHDLDEWLEERLRNERDRAASDILLEAIHGGLRLQRGYMRRQRTALAALIEARDRDGYESYRRALADSFGSAYVQHVEAWLAADGLLAPGYTLLSSPASSIPPTSTAATTDADVTAKL
jgi:hypothetical protein